MSGPRFPAELFDHIVDLLQDSRDALKSCCLTSKSWIPSTRKHLFAEVEFDDAEDVESWKIAFPNPSTSPAVYTKALYVGSFCAVLATDAEEGGWMSSFSQVVHLEISTDEHANFNFTLLHGFSPVLKSLNVTFFKFQSSQIFDLICSFPLLEDLFVSMRLRNPTDLDNHSFNEQSTITKLSTSPPFTGCLELGPAVGIEPIASRSLSLPGSLCFRQLSLALRFEADALIIGAPVEECCFTLEYLDVFDGGGPGISFLRLCLRQ